MRVAGRRQTFPLDAASPISCMSISVRMHIWKKHAKSMVCTPARTARSATEVHTSNQLVQQPNAGPMCVCACSSHWEEHLIKKSADLASCGAASKLRGPDVRLCWVQCSFNPNPLCGSLSCSCPQYILCPYSPTLPRFGTAVYRSQWHRG